MGKFMKFVNISNNIDILLHLGQILHDACFTYYTFSFDQSYVEMSMNITKSRTNIHNRSYNAISVDTEPKYILYFFYTFNVIF